MSALGHVIKLTSVWDDFGDAACLRFLQRQGFPWVPQINAGLTGNKEGKPPCLHRAFRSGFVCLPLPAQC
jgi:hypothetical protein